MAASALVVRSAITSFRSSSIVRACVLNHGVQRLVSGNRGCGIDVSRSYGTAQDGPSSMVGRDFLTLKNYSAPEIKTLLWTAMDLKYRVRHKHETLQELAGKSIALIFQKRSTRTRLSTETGMYLLGGRAFFLSPDDVHIGVNESLTDTARVLSRFNDMILARVFGQDDIEMLAREASVPVISGLSDLYHPLQALADLVTIQERFGHLRGLHMAWVGDGNNIIHSLMMAGIKMGLDFSVATPKGYECDAEVTRDAVNISTEVGTKLKFTTDPMEAVKGANIIVTDTWISMGQEEEKAERMKSFAGYQVNRKMMDTGAPGCIFLHCLPRKPEEVTDQVFYSKDSLVWDEAENRMWTVMAVMLHHLKDYQPTIPKPAFDGPSHR